MPDEATHAEKDEFVPFRVPDPIPHASGAEEPVPPIRKRSKAVPPAEDAFRLNPERARDDPRRITIEGDTESSQGSTGGGG